MKNVKTILQKYIKQFYQYMDEVVLKSLIKGFNLLGEIENEQNELDVMAKCMPCFIESPQVNIFYPYRSNDPQPSVPSKGNALSNALLFQSDI